MEGWSTALPDWESRLLAGEPLVPDLPLFADEADRAERIFRRLRLPDVPGNPTLAEACGDWFFRIVRVLFGSYDLAANVRLIQEYFLLVPKKNSKTSYGAALMVVALILVRRPMAELLLVAPTKEIADLAFKQAAGMIALDEELRKRFHHQRHLRLITNRKTGVALQIKAADTDVITGSKSTGILIDETHVFAKKPRAADIFVEVRGALAARPDGFMIQITTQSKEPPTGVFRSELNIAREVRDGKLALPLLAVLYELPHRIANDGGWKNRRWWPLINPNLERSVDAGFLARELVKAEREGPAQLALLASQHFNVEIGLSLQSDRWVGADHWDGRAEPALTYEALLERSEVVVIGIDGGGLDDLLGFAAMGRRHDGEGWLLWNRAWAHQTVLQRRQSEAPRLRELERTGDLVIVESLGEDVEQIADLVAQAEAAGVLAGKNAVGVDPMGIGQVVDAIVARGIESDRIVGVPQGWKLNGAIKTCERKLVEGTLNHAGQDLMRWAVGNAKVEPKGNAITITKQ
ncbi:MAG: terminase large subunit, partial [Reyranellaceae bacterium]